MQNFLEALISERKNTALPEEYDYFGKLIGKFIMLTIIILLQLKGNGTFRGFLKGWQFKMLLSCQIMNMERRFVFIIPRHTHGMSLMVTLEK